MLDVEKFRVPLGTWFEKIKPFLESDEGEKLYSILKNRARQGNKILPTSENTYKAFKLCPLDSVKCIIIGMSPYHTLKDSVPCADGLAFSNGLVEEESPSLKLFYNAMARDLENPGIARDLDLSYLAKQGVLLLNASLTTEMGKAGVHNDMKLWDGFYKFLFKEVLDTLCGVPILLCGDEAEAIGKKYFFNMCHVSMKVEHPARAARLHREWDNKGCFNWINKIIKENNGNDFETIEWSNEKTPWEES